MPEESDKSVESRLGRMEEALEAIAGSFAKFDEKVPTYTEARPLPPYPTPTPGPRPGPEALAAVASLSGSSLIPKFVSFASGLDDNELKELGVLLAPAVAAAEQARSKPFKASHREAADFLQQLDVRLERGRIDGSKSELMATPTITTVTITTTVASHPIIGCSVTAESF